MTSEPNQQDPLGQDPDESAFDPTLGVPGAGGEMPKVIPVTDAPCIPDVTVTGILGKGGQGVVFKGHQDFLGRDVAIKVLHRSVDRDLARFRQEATLLARLQHPNVVACYQAGVTEENQCYMVLEFIDGQDLYQHVKASGPLSEDSALALVADVAQGLKHGYEANARMIHRDVKPQNVLLQVAKGGLGPSIKGKIVDLGLARCLEESMELTRAGAVMGTPSTMAPEQYDCPDEVDHRTDIYGLGCVLFFAITGDPAFKGKTFTAIYRQKTAKEAARPHKDLAISAGTKALLDKMLARAQDKRPATYDELLDQIREVRAGLKRTSIGKVKKSKAMPIAAAALALGAAGFGVKLMLGGDEAVLPSMGAESVADKEVLASSSNAGEDLASPHTAQEVPVTAAEEAEPLALTDSEAEDKSAKPVVAVRPPGPAPLPALAKGVPIPLFQGEEPFKGWWTAGGPVDDGVDSFLWKARRTVLPGTPSEEFRIPSGSPLGAFEDDHPMMVTLMSLREKYAPEPFYIDGVNAIAHALPTGDWGLRGRMALRQEGGEEHLVGGWALQRQDGSVLELAMAVHFPDGSMAGDDSSRQGAVRAAWLRSDGRALHAGESAEVLESKSGKGLGGAEAAARLSGYFLGEPKTVYDGDVFVIDFELRVTEGSYKLVLGDSATGLEDLPVPRDFPGNGFSQLLVYGRSGVLALRDWSLFGL